MKSQQTRVLPLLITLLLLLPVAASAQEGDGVFLPLVSSGDSAQTPPANLPEATVALVQDGDEQVLVAGAGTDFAGAPLYRFASDEENAQASACTAGCTATWPALTVDSPGALTAADALVDQLSLIERADGALHVAFNGWPLYRHAGDAASRATGEGTDGLWWRVALPALLPADPDPGEVQPFAQTTPPRLFDFGEAGQLELGQPDRDSWQSVDLAQSYTNPLVFLGPPSTNGGQPTTLRVRNVTSDSFEVKLDEWAYLDGFHLVESLSYFVVEAGTHALGGLKIEATSTEAGKAFSRLDFANSFEATPVVVSQIQSVNGDAPLTVRQRNANSGGVELRLQSEEAVSLGNASETVGVLVVQFGALDGIEARRTGDKVTDKNFALSFENAYQQPLLFGDLASFDGSDTATLRYRQLSGSGATIFVQEEQSRDSELFHTTETVGYFVVEGATELSSTPTPGPTASAEPTPAPTLTPTPMAEPTATPTPTSEPSGGSTQTVTYEPSSENFLNPERGFHGNISLVDETSLSWVRNQGHALARAYVRLDDYRYQPLPNSLLADVQRGLDAAREADIKIVLRFAYNFGIGEDDTTLSWVEQHIEQVTPLLEQNADVIAVVQAGFIGAWGEWHSSENGLDSDENKAAIHALLLAAVPDSRMVQLRYPGDLINLYPQPLAADNAFSDSAKARTGHVNDCFLSGPNDVGTYWPPERKPEFFSYLDELTLWTVTGGETCNADVDNARFSCDIAVAEMERFHWDYLNEDFWKGAIDQWKAEGCYDEIARRLGYRYRLIETTAPLSIEQGSAGEIAIRLANDGFGKLYNERGVELIFRNQQSGAEYAIDLATDEDVRSWLPRPGAETTLDITANVPSDLAPGTYDLFLNLPDASPLLRDDPGYSIRLANQNVWEAETGYNSLNVSVAVAAK